MAKKNYTAEQIISKLREVEVKLGQGIKASEAIRSIVFLLARFDQELRIDRDHAS